MLKRRRAARRTSSTLTRGSCKLCCFFYRAALKAYERRKDRRFCYIKDDSYDARP